MSAGKNKIFRRKISEEKLFQGSWLSIKKATYLSRSGKEVNWEVVERARPETVLIIIAQLLPSRRYILLKQFRAGINRHVISLPAGIVPAGQDVRKQALQELKEETGYVGKIVSVSPTLKINPAILDCDVHIFQVKIDERDPRNARPRQKLEPEEEIEVIRKRREEIKGYIVEEQTQGTAVDVSVWFSFSI